MWWGIFFLHSEIWGWIWTRAFIRPNAASHSTSPASLIKKILTPPSRLHHIMLPSVRPTPPCRRGHPSPHAPILRRAASHPCHAISPAMLRHVPCWTSVCLARRGHDIHRTTTTPTPLGGGRHRPGHLVSRGRKKRPTPMPGCPLGRCSRCRAC
jgi:hypothetical protein